MHIAHFCIYIVTISKKHKHFLAWSRGRRRPLERSRFGAFTRRPWAPRSLTATKSTSSALWRRRTCPWAVSSAASSKSNLGRLPNLFLIPKTYLSALYTYITYIFDIYLFEQRINLSAKCNSPPMHLSLSLAFFRSCSQFPTKGNKDAPPNLFHMSISIP